MTEALWNATDEYGDPVRPVARPVSEINDCFPAATPITLWGGATKPIEQITTTDAVLTHDTNGTPVAGIVDKLFTNTTKDFIRLTFTDGRDDLLATPGHRFLTETGDYMEIGHMLRLGGGSVRVVDQSGAVITATGEVLEYSAQTADMFPVTASKTIAFEGNAVLKQDVQEGWTTYNFEVREHHNYVADGIRVHNDSILSHLEEGDTLVALSDDLRDAIVIRDVDDDGDSEIVFLDGLAGTGGDTELVGEYVFYEVDIPSIPGLPIFDLVGWLNGQIDTYPTLASNPAALNLLLADLPGLSVTNGLFDGSGLGVDGWILNGTNVNDDLVGSSGNDTINGGDGDDLIHGQDGDDTLNGGAGNDTLYGDAGDDTVDGGAGDDVVRGGDGADLLFGRTGADTLAGNSGNDRLFGGGQNDLLFGGDGDDELNGGSNNDTLYGGADSDVLNGDDGNDIADGGDGDDVVYGGAGNDTLYGGAGDDIVDGGAGDDVVRGGDGADMLFGRAGADTLAGNSVNDRLFGGGQNDRLFGGGGDDELNGGSHDDTLSGGYGSDSLTGDSGADTFLFETTPGTDTVQDFEDGTDVIEYQGGAFADLTIVAAGADVDITGANGGHMILLNTDLALVTVDDFVF